MTISVMLLLCIMTFLRKQTFLLLYTFHKKFLKQNKIQKIPFVAFHNFFSCWCKVSFFFPAVLTHLAQKEIWCSLRLQSRLIQKITGKWSNFKPKTPHEYNRLSPWKRKSLKLLYFAGSHQVIKEQALFFHAYTLQKLIKSKQGFCIIIFFRNEQK